MLLQASGDPDINRYHYIIKIIEVPASIHVWIKKINLASCCATHIGIKYLDYILSSYWSLPYSPKQGADICYEADCYTENNIIGDKEYDSDKQNSNTSREEHDKKKSKFWKTRTFIRIPSKF
jgi:hypothetical protein